MQEGLPRFTKKNFADWNNVKMARSKARQRRSARFSSSKFEKTDEINKQNEEKPSRYKNSNPTDVQEQKYQEENCENSMFLSSKQYDAIFGEPTTAEAFTSEKADCPPIEKV